jgi:hypothetical protein
MDTGVFNALCSINGENWKKMTAFLNSSSGSEAIDTEMLYCRSHEGVEDPWG